MVAKDGGGMDNRIQLPAGSQRPAGVLRSMRILVGILADIGYQESKAFKGRECSMLY